MSDDELLRFSLCSMHQEKHEGCVACGHETFMTREEHEKDQELFRYAFPVWFAKHNGRLPEDSSWHAWELITGKTRPR